MCGPGRRGRCWCCFPARADDLKGNNVGQKDKKKEEKRQGKERLRLIGVSSLPFLEGRIQGVVFANVTSWSAHAHRFFEHLQGVCFLAIETHIVDTPLHDAIQKLRRPLEL